VFGRAVAPGDAEGHAQTATAAYLEGLRAYGWRGEEKDVRFAAEATGALQELSFAACHLAWLCPEFGEVQPWPEDLAESQSTDVRGDGRLVSIFRLPVHTGRTRATIGGGSLSAQPGRATLILVALLRVEIDSESRVLKRQAPRRVRSADDPGDRGDGRRTGHGGRRKNSK
jgi:hypothetical protein